MNLTRRGMSGSLCRIHILGSPVAENLHDFTQCSASDIICIRTSCKYTHDSKEPEEVRQHRVRQNKNVRCDPVTKQDLDKAEHIMVTLGKDELHIEKYQMWRGRVISC